MESILTNPDLYLNWWFALVAWYLLRNQTRHLEELTKSFKVLANNVGKTYLNANQTTMMFKLVMSEHIQKKIEICDQILTENDIFNREEQIKDNIYNDFQTITAEETNKLSQFNTPAWDLGLLVKTNIDWNKFMEDIYKRIFSRFSKEIKLSYLKKTMQSYANDILAKIEKKIRENTFNY